MLIKQETRSVYILLRPYQKKIVDAIIKAYENGYVSPLAQAPTGAGKSIILMALFEYFLNKDQRIGLVVHKEELISQWVRGFEAFLPNYSRSILGNRQKYRKLYDHHADIHIFSIKCLAPCFHKPEIDLLAYDEAHHIPAREWCQSLYDYRNQLPNLKVLGATATPIRTDGKGLRHLHLERMENGKKIKIPVAGFDFMALGPQVSELIKDGHLVPTKLFAGSKIANADGYRTSGGEFRQKDMEELMEFAVPVNTIIDEWFEKGKMERTVVYTVSVEYSKKLEIEFNKRIPGIAKHIDCTTLPYEREKAIEDFREGKIKILLQYAIVVEGVDIPQIGCVVSARPTASVSLWLQTIGRALRPAEGKEYMILLDFTDNHQRLPMPEDHIDWSLDGFINHNYFFCKACGKERRFTFILKTEFPAHITYEYKCRKCGGIHVKKTHLKDGIEKIIPEPEQIELEQKRLERKKYSMIPRPDFYEYINNKDYGNTHEAVADYVVAFHKYRLSRKKFTPRAIFKECIKSFDREDYIPNKEVLFLMYQAFLGGYTSREKLYSISEITLPKHIEALNQRLLVTQANYKNTLRQVRYHQYIKAGLNPVYNQK